MVTADIVELDSVLVEVVEDGQTELISLTVVRLWTAKTTKKARKRIRKIRWDCIAVLFYLLKIYGFIENMFKGIVPNRFPLNHVVRLRNFQIKNQNT